jgi:pimeloyl-ACP methyl ester carboxylesterase
VADLDAVRASTGHEQVILLGHSWGVTRFAPNQECADALTAEVRTLDLVTACRELPVRTVIVHGALDLRPPPVTDSLAEALPDSTRVIIEGAAHYPWLEAPAAFLAAVEPHLGSCSAPAVPS